MKYTPTIGLEIHAELKTKTKMFCNSLNVPLEDEPNVNICPVCMAHPGTLPVPNKEAIKKVLMVGLAVGGSLADTSRFDRKNYFYPDIPKGYQISQYQLPLVAGGKLNGVRVTRVHLEEDTARLSHDTNKDSSLVDFNRAGIPLLELVTEPDISSGEEASSFAKEFQLLLRYLGASDADMEKGLMRVEVNISVAPESAEDTASWQNGHEGNSSEKHIADSARGEVVLGTKVEIKNLNSFRTVERAVEYEIKRQSEILESGGKVKQETRGWDENKQKTFSQREKEEAHDYRYFPEPDILEFSLTEIKKEMDDLPELPQEKRERLARDYHLEEKAIDVFTQDKILADYFEAVATHLAATPPSELRMAVNYITSDLQGLLKERKAKPGELSAAGGKIKPQDFSELIKLIGSGKITSRVAKDILPVMFATGRAPAKIIEEKGLEQTSDEVTIKKIAAEIIKNNSSAAADYKAGKENSLKFLIGQGMRETKGSANPQILEKIFKELLA